MTVAIAPHPAASLPLDDRLLYLRILASVAIADGHTDRPELAKLRRLAGVLELPDESTLPIFSSLMADRLDAVVTSTQAASFRGMRAVRSYLVMDAIVIAFSDARLLAGESRRIGELAVALGVDPDEVYMLAGFVEKILFKRDADHRVLAAELGAAVGAPGAGEGLVQMVRKLAGELADERAVGALLGDAVQGAANGIVGAASDAD